VQLSQRICLACCCENIGSGATDTLVHVDRVLASDDIGNGRALGLALGLGRHSGDGKVSDQSIQANVEQNRRQWQDRMLE
jgi:hypothetical protein